MKKYQKKLVLIRYGKWIIDKDEKNKTFLSRSRGVTKIEMLK